MWFKNLTLFRLPGFALLADEVENQLKAHALVPCAQSEMASTGWSSPFGPIDHSQTFLHAVNGYWLMTFAKEERLLPAAVIKEALIKKIDELQQAEDRQVFRKEKLRLKEEIIFTLMPKAFTRTVHTSLYIDTRRELLVIDTSSPSRAEAVLTLLRQTFADLMITSLQTNESPQQLLTNWLVGEHLPTQFLIEDQCELIDTKNPKAAVKMSHTLLTEQQLQQHVQMGMRVKQLGLTWRDKLTFVLQDTLCIKRIRPLSLLIEKVKETPTETTAEAIDLDFSLMTLEYGDLIDELIELSGGLLQRQSTQQQEDLAYV